jgi:hypothetical protein
VKSVTQNVDSLYKEILSFSVWVEIAWVKISKWNCLHVDMSIVGEGNAQAVSDNDVTQLLTRLHVGAFTAHWYSLTKPTPYGAADSPLSGSGYLYAEVICLKDTMTVIKETLYYVMRDILVQLGFSSLISQTFNYLLHTKIQAHLMGGWAKCRYILQELFIFISVTFSTQIIRINSPIVKGNNLKHYLYICII